MNGGGSVNKSVHQLLGYAKRGVTLPEPTGVKSCPISCLLFVHLRLCPINIGTGNDTTYYVATIPHLAGRDVALLHRASYPVPTMFSNIIVMANNIAKVGGPTHVQGVS